MTYLLFLLISCGISCAFGWCLGSRRERGAQARRDQILAAEREPRKSSKGGVRLRSVSFKR